MRFNKIIILLLPLLASCAFAQTQGIVYPNGRSVDIVVPANQYVSVFASGPAQAKVFKQVGGPASNVPAMFTLETTYNGGIVQSGEVVFGPYTTGITLRVFAFADPVLYSLGALGAIYPVLRPQPRSAKTQFAPATQTVAATLLSSDLTSGIIVGTPTATGATVAYTLPTGTLLDAATMLQVSQGFEWSIINLAAAAADTITVTAGTGHTLVGSGIVPSSHATTGGVYGNAARFFSRKTATNTFVTYRIH